MPRTRKEKINVGRDSGRRCWMESKGYWQIDGPQQCPGGRGPGVGLSRLASFSKSERKGVIQKLEEDVRRNLE